MPPSRRPLPGTIDPRPAMECPLCDVKRKSSTGGRQREPRKAPRQKAGRSSRTQSGKKSNGQEGGRAVTRFQDKSVPPVRLASRELPSLPSHGLFSEQPGIEPSLKTIDDGRFSRTARQSQAMRVRWVRWALGSLGEAAAHPGMSIHVVLERACMTIYERLGDPVRVLEGPWAVERPIPI